MRLRLNNIIISLNTMDFLKLDNYTFNLEMTKSRPFLLRCPTWSHFRSTAAITINNICSLDKCFKLDFYDNLV